MDKNKQDYIDDKITQFFVDNQKALENPIIKGFLANKNNYKLVVKAIIEPTKANREKVDEAFTKHYNQVKKIKYINNLIRFVSIDYDKKIRKLNQRFLLTLDQPLSDNNHSTMKDLIIDDNNIDLDDIVKLSLKNQIQNEKLYKSLDVLTQKQALILEMIYVNNLSLREIAKILDSTPQNVSNIHKKALKKLQKEIS
ncbi:RNA polymerase sigma factor, sigma-70 family protein [Anoxybacillus sp. B7M1]|jgi:RNA polymerase sigma factor (sigma-70 family)|uniref:sigma-70 family RNA polymerase sigma factor n=1 Tax=unclassified Anoxybacillus TaxID=2639704 RepID=UPI0005CD32D9|nr:MULTISPECIES: sigma-70 family RNA polymerase sigma factor [unclassified Anoxybacillus]ANB56973.1 RNA polymerase sigma factor, sigma-70 family protein [Anoxybacillus sp. B2M1]ANB64984.1 RNA polymerase sigma factor, sigma-70 family protein [Anoxybacillus sp. B7M1]